MKFSFRWTKLKKCAQVRSGIFCRFEVYFCSRALGRHVVVTRPIFLKPQGSNWPWTKFSWYSEKIFSLLFSRFFLSFTKTSGKIELDRYESNANHVWNIDADCSSVDVDVTKMDTEPEYDYLFIHENKFSGADPFKVKSEDILFLGWKRFIFNMYLITFKVTDLPSSFEIAFTSDEFASEYDGFTLYWSCSETPGK